jgi:3-deoxy-manno-octulosonate cytidylyltransferase (CMP-KDO synthetase)
MTAIVIPARWGSSRFPGKPLVDLHGRPLIEWVWRAARRTGLPVYVATDDARIAAHVRDIGGEVVMTGSAKNGTERCALAARALKLTGPVINWQGDSPLVPKAWISALLDALDGPNLSVTTPVQRCEPDMADRIRVDRLSGLTGATTAVLDSAWRALYFSKSPLPTWGPMWMHVGIYAYSAEALASYGTEESLLEKAEKLEQLRFLERGIPITAVPVDGLPIWEVNNPADVPIVKRMMLERASGALWA